MHVPLAHQQHQLTLGKLGVDFGESQAMEGPVPGREPWIFPFVGHGNDIGVVQMLPVGIAPMFALRGRWRLGRITLQPKRHIVVKKLLAPEHARKSLALHQPCVGAVDGPLQARVELVRLAASAGEDRIKISP